MDNEELLAAGDALYRASNEIKTAAVYLYSSEEHNKTVSLIMAISSFTEEIAENIRDIANNNL